MACTVQAVSHRLLTHRSVMHEKKKKADKLYRNNRHHHHHSFILILLYTLVVKVVGAQAETATPVACCTSNRIGKKVMRRSPVFTLHLHGGPCSVLFCLALLGWFFFLIRVAFLLACGLFDRRQAQWPAWPCILRGMYEGERKKRFIFFIFRSSPCMKVTALETPRCSVIRRLQRLPDAATR
jgi:MFS family permease